MDLSMPLSEVEPIMLLHTLERMVTLLASIGTPRPSLDGTRRSHEGSSGLLSMMSGVFIAEPTATPENVGFNMREWANVPVQG